MDQLNHGNGSNFNRRKFVKLCMFAGAALFIPGCNTSQKRWQRIQTWTLPNGYKPVDHYWGMGVDINKCIGCGRCVEACKNENNVPKVPFFFRTWVERYRIFEHDDIMVDSPNGAMDGFQEQVVSGKKLVRSFFVPKLCNHCDRPPCVQVCPVGATYRTPDGVVLVDEAYCIGCRYCIQACPYGARFIHPEKHVAEKCTFCYHRITQGLLPACVEVCPTQARIFGEVKKTASPVARFVQMNKIGVLKAALNTQPKVFYANLDMEVS
jgi:tetrathionate reductase subunit B